MLKKEQSKKTILAELRPIIGECMFHLLKQQILKNKFKKARYSSEIKIISMSFLLVLKPSKYNFLRQILPLPSLKTVYRIYLLTFSPGLNLNILSLLKIKLSLNNNQIKRNCLERNI